MSHATERGVVHSKIKCTDFKSSNFGLDWIFSDFLGFFGFFLFFFGFFFIFSDFTRIFLSEQLLFGFIFQKEEMIFY